LKRIGSVRKLNLLISLTLLGAMPANAEVRDPTQPGNLPPSQLITPQNGDMPLTLTAIWISDSTRHATINGVTVKAGQKLDPDSRVINIQPGYVLIKRHGIHSKLYLVPPVKHR
jgi:hypothetical protein